MAWYTAAGTFGAGLPAGTFLAGLAPWGQWPHPALWLYGLGLAWAAVIALLACTGPWRRQSFGPPGFVCAVTAAVIAVDVITGSRLQLGAPFGLSLVEAGRLYGVGNNALGVYAVAGMWTAAWAAHSFLRVSGAGGEVGAAVRGIRRRRLAVATAAAAAVALAVVIASGWPGFGAKVGGTIAMVPAFLVLLAAVAGIKVTVRRALLIAVSGLVLVALFAVADYFIPAIGPSHLGDFVGSIIHGGAERHAAPQDQLEPALADRDLVHPGGSGRSARDRPDAGLARAAAMCTGCADGVRIAAPDPQVPIRCCDRACSRSGWPSCSRWLVDDSGVSLAAAALPVALPLAIVLVVRTDKPTAGGQASDRRANVWPDRAIAK